MGSKGCRGDALTQVDSKQQTKRDKFIVKFELGDIEESPSNESKIRFNFDDTQE